MDSFNSDSRSKSSLYYRNILALHKLTDRVTYGSINISPSRFSNWLRRLQDDSYTFVPLSSILNYEQTDNKAVAFVFDDGYAHLAETLPLLMSKFDIKPAIALPTYYIDSGNRWDYSSLVKQEFHLSKKKIVDLSKAGVEFVSHGHTHVALTDCSETKLIAELIRSKEILEDLISKPVTTISYPFGACNSRVVDRALAAGYTHGLTMSHPTRDDNSMQIGRYGVHCFDSYNSVLSYLERRSSYKIYQAVSKLTSSLAKGTQVLQRLQHK